MIKVSQSKIVNIKLIKKTRLSKGITTEQMSKLMGYKGDNAYYRKETGNRNFNLEDVVKVSKILELPIQQIFFEQRVTVKETNCEVI